MRRKPDLFPIVSWVKENGLYTYWEKRQYSNNWYRQFGTSQALPVNDNNFNSNENALNWIKNEFNRLNGTQ